MPAPLPARLRQVLSAGALRRFLLPAGTALLLTSALSAAVPGGPAYAQQTASDTARPSGSLDTKAGRLARDLRLLEQRRQMSEESEHLDGFLAKIEALSQKDEDSRWLKTSNGWLRMKSLRQYVTWNSPAEGRQEIVAEAVDLENHPFATIVDFSRQLEAHGMDLLLVVVPFRLHIYGPELIQDLELGDAFRGMTPGTTRFLLRLVRAGVEVLDLTPAFAQERKPGPDAPDELFRRSDSHWTPRGAELGARLVAQRIREYPGLPVADLVEGADYTLKREPRLVADGPLAPPGAQQESLIFSSLRTATGSYLLSTQKDSPLLVLGDSFTGIYSDLQSGFPMHLYRFSGIKPDLITIRGGGVKTCREALRRRRDNLQGKRLVVWVLCIPTLLPHKRWQPLKMFQD